MLELQNQLKIFVSISQGRGGNSSPTHQPLIHAGHSVRQLLLEKSISYRAQEAFRHLSGFQAVLTAFETLIRIVKLCASNRQEHHSIQDLIQMLFGVLTAALQEHKGNQNYFRQFHPGGGWQTLNNSLELLIEYLKKIHPDFSEAVIEQLFGCLLSCATNDDVMAELFGKLRRSLQDPSSQDTADASK